MISGRRHPGAQAYWYLTRATGDGFASAADCGRGAGFLGPMGVSSTPRWPRFAADSLHRDLSLLAVAVSCHVVTTVLDGFAPIGLIDAIIPFHSPYRPCGWASVRSPST